MMMMMTFSSLNLTLINLSFMHLSVAGKESLCRTCYFTVLNVQEAMRMLMPECTLCKIRFLLLTHFFKLETSEWSLEPTVTLSASGGSISSQKEIHCH